MGQNEAGIEYPLCSMSGYLHTILVYAGNKKSLLF